MKKRRAVGVALALATPIAAVCLDATPAAAANAWPVKWQGPTLNGRPLVKPVEFTVYTPEPAELLLPAVQKIREAANRLNPQR